MSDLERPSPTCATCDSPHVNHSKSWNQAGEWTCDDCWPDDPNDDGQDDR